MNLEDARQQKSLPEPVSRRILSRPVDRSTRSILEEVDSGYESVDQSGFSEPGLDNQESLELKTIGRSTHEWDIRDKIRRMQQELEAPENSLPPKPTLQVPAKLRNTSSQPPVTLDIALISPEGFRVQASHKKNVSFFTSLYEINQILEERELTNNDTTVDEIWVKLPRDY